MKVFDGHNDVLLRLREKGGTFFDRSGDGHLDLPRARQGNLAGGFCAIFVPSPEKGMDVPMSAPPPAEASSVAMGMMADLMRIESASGGEVTIVADAEALEQALAADRFAAVIHIEGAEPIDEDFANLEVFYRAGLRSLGLVWSRSNAFGHGVPFRESHPDTGPGLTDAGKELIRACNRLGIMVDLSHLNEKGFWDVAAISDAPLVATHSNAHALCATSRNLTDRQLDAIRESDGMVGVNFAVYFLEEGGSPETTSLDAIVRHVHYLADRVGIERVGFGSDFDGAGVPADLGDVTGLPRLIAALRDAGFSEEDIARISHRNWIRVLRKTWGQ